MILGKARVTSKGQATLPADLRRRLDIRAGDDLYFDDHGDGVMVHVVHRHALTELFGVLPAPDPFPDLETVGVAVRASVAAHVVKDGSARGKRGATAHG